MSPKNCKFCLTDLWHEHSFIRCVSPACVKLNVSICLQCFAAGTKDDIHNNTDPYQVLCNAIKLDDRSWSAHEEIILLDTFTDTLSWEKVAKKLGKSPQDCEYHYFNNFVLYPRDKDLERVNKNAFRFDKFSEVFEDRTKTIGDTSDLEGI